MQRLYVHFWDSKYIIEKPQNIQGEQSSYQRCSLAWDTTELILGSISPVCMNNPIRSLAWALVVPFLSLSMTLEGKESLSRQSFPFESRLVPGISAVSSLLLYAGRYWPGQDPLKWSFCWAVSKKKLSGSTCEAYANVKSDVLSLQIAQLIVEMVHGYRYLFTACGKATIRGISWLP